MLEEPEEVDVRYKEVQCKTCQRKYTCTPQDDYYNYSNATDGVCGPCLMDSIGAQGPMINIGMPPD